MFLEFGGSFCHTDQSLAFLASCGPDLMDGCKLVELEKKLRKEQGTVTRERLEELLGEAIDPGKVAIVVDLVFSALDLPEDGGIEVESLARLVEAKNISGEMLRQRLRWLFRMYDTDASGTISLGEMVEIFSGLYLAEVVYNMIYKTYHILPFRGNM